MQVDYNKMEIAMEKGFTKMDVCMEMLEGTAKLARQVGSWELGIKE